jgi:hypothetical protein
MNMELHGVAVYLGESVMAFEKRSTTETRLLMAGMARANPMRLNDKSRDWTWLKVLLVGVVIGLVFSQFI